MGELDRIISMNSQSAGFDLVSESGVGRAFILVYEEEGDGAFARAAAERIAAKSRCIVLRSPGITGDNWGALTDQLRTHLQSKNVRQGSFVGFGAAGALVQNICLLDPRTVRAAVLFRAASRAHPRLFDRLIDRMESALPLGLPLRRAERGFDSRPFLQRIRCPILIVTSPEASNEEQRDATMMAERMPTAWQVTLGDEDRPAEFSRLVLDFSEVPAKAPQKNTANDRGV
ncbi:MAG: hypothetical protein RL417_1057 [Pseudomonadota bacterium]|jgi:hypothetical protein